MPLKPSKWCYTSSHLTAPTTSKECPLSVFRIRQHLWGLLLSTVAQWSCTTLCPTVQELKEISACASFFCFPVFRSSEEPLLQVICWSNDVPPYIISTEVPLCKARHMITLNVLHVNRFNSEESKTLLNSNFIAMLMLFLARANKKFCNPETLFRWHRRLLKSPKSISLKKCTL